MLRSVEGDAVRIGRQHVRDGIATIRTEKTGTEVHLPILPELQEVIARDIVYVFWALSFWIFLASIVFLTRLPDELRQN